MTKRYKAQVVHAMVGNSYVEGYQVYVDRLDVAANGVTVLASTAERIPADRGVTFQEADEILRGLGLQMANGEDRYYLPQGLELAAGGQSLVDPEVEAYLAHEAAEGLE